MTYVVLGLVCETCLICISYTQLHTHSSFLLLFSLFNSSVYSINLILEFDPRSAGYYSPISLSRKASDGSI